MKNSTKIILTENKKISCKGEGEKIGHPLVFFDMGEAEEISCPYCNTKFLLKKLS